jgi:isocitrate/isopropylmalate dehydrogenase
MTDSPSAVTLIPGDGIGPEVMACARQALAATAVPFSWSIEEAASADLPHGMETHVVGTAAFTAAIIEKMHNS